MFRDRRPLRVAIIGTNNDKSYSGGRYLALIMAYALAAEGQEVHVVTNKKPLFLGDLDPIAPGAVSFAYTADFVANLPDGTFDYVILIPTGVFHPEFYENVLAFARRAKARLALLNFESANWFNTIAPVPKDPRLWDYWRRSVVEGGLVLSIAHASQPFARPFYAAPESHLRFEVIHPPINTMAADAVSPVERDDAVLCFVRSTDAHKGGTDLLDLDPQLFAGRILRIVSGGDMDSGFRDALETRLQSATGARLEVHTAVPDADKFALIARSKALLFPSRFEGFGYPPVEAAYMGTEIACYDIPVLRETVGGIAHMAAPFDAAALGRALAAALSAPARADALRAEVRSRFGLPAAGAYLHEILERSLDAVPRLQGGAPRAVWGPWREERPPAPTAIRPNTWIAPVPPHLVTAAQTAAGDIVVDIRVACNQPINFAEVEHPAFGITDAHIRPLQAIGDATLYGVAFLAPQAMLGQKFRLNLRQRGYKHTFDVEFCITTPVRMDSCTLHLRTMAPLPRSRLHLIGEIAGRLPPDEIALTANGRSWVVAACHDGRFNLTAEVPDPSAGITLYAYRQGRVMGVFGGFPATEGLRRNSRIAAPTLVAPTRITPVNLSDAHWNNGVMRKPPMPNLGVLLVKSGDLGGLAVGDTVRLPATDRLLVVRQIIAKGTVSHLVFEDALSPYLEGFPNLIEIVGTAEIEGTQVRIEPLTKGAWQNGVWSGEGSYQGRILCIAKGQQRERLPWSVLAFPRSGLRCVVSVTPGPEMDMLVLDRPILPVSDTREPVIVHAAATGPADRPLRIADRSGGGWRNGVMEEGPLALRRVLFEAEDRSAEGLVPGRELRFAGSGLRKVLSVAPAEGGTVEAVVDRALSPDRDGAPLLAIRPQAKVIAENRQSTPLYPSPVAAVAVKWPLAVIDRQRRSRSGADAVSATDAVGDRPRVLFVTVVPPVPADQGNRVATKNFVAHLVAQGFDVDIVLIGEVDPAAIGAAFGDRVRVFPWPFPAWSRSASASLRRDLLVALHNEPFERTERFVRDALSERANWYHPYFIVPDQVVAIARRLYARYSYHSIVCNYSHSVRVAKELEDIRPLPPVAIITIDAQSRLPRETDGTSFDTSYRLCPPEVERAVLDAVPGATVVAISQSEARYFRDIGVRNPVVLCEYDGFDEFAPHRTPETAFDATTFVFQGSGNPMNVAALNWFADTCWIPIIRHLPQAQLVICGRVSTQWTPNLPNLSLLGILPRPELLALAERTTVAINPTLAGTGLKIKTVEAACAGTPSVFLPAAIDGIEDVAGAIGCLAVTPEDFVRHCITLATNRAQWSALRASAIKVAATRFSAQAVYAGVDACMGWDSGAEARRAALRAPYVLSAPAVIDPGEGKVQSLASQLIEMGEQATAIRLLERDASSPLTAAGKFSVLIGTRSLDLGDYAQALRYAADSIAAAPWDLAGYDLMIAALVGNGNLSEARETLALAALACPSSPDLAALERRIGDGDSAPRQSRLP